MWCVYIIRSEADHTRRYIGLTNDLNDRLQRHNQGRSPHTSKYTPWELDVVIAFTDKPRAAAFEQYLKSGSGFSFAKRHFERRDQP